MKLRIVCVVAAFLSLNLTLAAQNSVAQSAFSQISASQASGSSAASAQVPPPLIQFSNVATDESGNALTGAVNITFSLYNAQQGGEPLWSETQNDVQLDSTGHYTVQLGSTQPNGVPTTLFTSGEARWLGVQIADQPLQPRVLLLSVPYALKAGDAQTIGGLPPSAFARVSSGEDSAGNGSFNFSAATSASGVSPAFSGGGTKGYLAVWSGSTSLTDSLLFETPLGNIGVSTSKPSQKFEVSSGNLLVQGPANFVGSGSTATVYVGDVNHSVEAISHSGLALGAYGAPQALFISDFTGDVA